MRAVIVAMAVALGGIAVTVLATSPRPMLVFNSSASAPPGLYRTASHQRLALGAWVLVRPPGWAAGLAAARQYLPQNVALIKRIAAVEGDTVCRTDRIITRNGREIAQALDHDSVGRVLPRWQGCRKLGSDSVFVINSPRHSFDSRYFGPVPRDHVIEEIAPLWTF